MSAGPGEAPLRWRWDMPWEPLLELLARGGVLALPTESSYGLAADPRSAAGVAAIYRLKGRDRHKPLPVVAADAEQLVALGVDDEDPGLAWARRHWPAPLTVVVALRPAAGLPAAGDGGTLAVRVPAHGRLRRLLAVTGPLTATSANRQGGAPICDPAELVPLLAGEEALIVGDEVLPGGPPSTLVRFAGEGVQVLRPGPFPVEGDTIATDR
ncbi:MAG: Sua5/YciO/YrdC/YwlC family protein [Acidobacteria bacterium]|nr:MAG: Sua5/YciO/YrdC/YwlC family protein [Acidobacteriota bacterium]